MPPLTGVAITKFVYKLTHFFNTLVWMAPRYLSYDASGFMRGGLTHNFRCDFIAASFKKAPVSIKVQGHKHHYRFAYW